MTSTRLLRAIVAALVAAFWLGLIQLVYVSCNSRPAHAAGKVINVYPIPDTQTVRIYRVRYESGVRSVLGTIKVVKGAVGELDTLVWAETEGRRTAATSYPVRESIYSGLASPEAAGVRVWTQVPIEEGLLWPDSTMVPGAQGALAGTSPLGRVLWRRAPVAGDIDTRPYALSQAKALPRICEILEAIPELRTPPPTTIPPPGPDDDYVQSEGWQVVCP